MCRPPKRFHEAAANVKEVILVTAAAMWCAAGVTFFVGVGRILWKVW